MWRKLLNFLIILHVKSFAMENLTTLPQNVQLSSPSNLTETVQDQVQPIITNENSTNSSLLSHFQELQPSKPAPHQTSKVSSSYQDQQTRQNDSSYQDRGDQANIFLKELETGLPESDDDVVPYKATADYLKRSSSLVEEGVKNATYTERLVYMAVGKSELIPCIEKLELRSTVKSITHVWTDHLGKEIKKRRNSRLNVDERYRLSITDAQTDDVGIYHCTLAIVYTDGGDDMNVDNQVSLNVYVTPDLALEFPFVFGSTTCDKGRDGQKLNEIKSIICTTSPCVYQFEMTCSVEPWRHRNMPYIPRSKLLILVTKFPDPDYKPPECERDCLMGNKFDHLLANLGIVKKAIDMTSNGSNLTFFSGLTMLNRKLVYSCEAGFSLVKESCVPCFPGTYNPKRQMNSCVPCPVSTYMEQPGARDCLQCETGKRTETIGAESVKQCVDKEIKIIRFRMAFFVLCGVVGGLVAILLAVFIVKIRDKMKKFIVPAGSPKETPSELLKLIKAKELETSKGATPRSTLPIGKQKKPSKEIVQLENKVTEKLKKVDNSERISGVNNVAVTNQPTHTEKAKPKQDVPGKKEDVPGEQTKRLMPMSAMVRQSVLDLRALAADFTRPVSENKPNRSALLKELKQLQLQDLGQVSRHHIRQLNLPTNTTLQSARGPSTAVTTSHQRSNLQPNTSSAVQPEISSGNRPSKQALQLSAPFDRPQVEPVPAPTGTSNAQPTAIPVGQIQPPAQPGPSSPNILNPQDNSHTFTPQTQINPPQVDRSLIQPAANLQKLDLPQSRTYISADAGQLSPKSLSRNLNQNAELNNYFSHGLLKERSLDTSYADRSYYVEDQEASRGQYFLQMIPPHHLYDQVFWMPSDTTPPSYTNIPMIAYNKNSFPSQRSPSNSNHNQMPVCSHGHVSGSQNWNQNGAEQNAYLTSSYAVQDPYQSENTYYIQQHYPNSMPGYHYIGQEDYTGDVTGLEQ